MGFLDTIKGRFGNGKAQRGTSRGSIRTRWQRKEKVGAGIEAGMDPIGYDQVATK
jgi:hypothetical protein